MDSKKTDQCPNLIMQINSKEYRADHELQSRLSDCAYWTLGKGTLTQLSLKCHGLLIFVSPASFLPDPATLKNVPAWLGQLLTCEILVGADCTSVTSILKMGEDQNPPERLAHICISKTKCCIMMHDHSQQIPGASISLQPEPRLGIGNCTFQAAAVNTSYFCEA